MIPRSLRCCLLLLAFVTAASAAPVTITPMFTGWREAGSFKRISEYFSGQENTGGQVVLRTHPEQRSGYYFQMRVATATTTDAKITLQVITPTNAAPVVYSFSSSIASPRTMINLGLTGTDWPDAGVNPVAWKVEFHAADGTLLGSEQSYLWGQSAGK